MIEMKDRRGQRFEDGEWWQEFGQELRDVAEWFRNWAGLEPVGIVVQWLRKSVRRFVRSQQVKSELMWWDFPKKSQVEMGSFRG